MRKPTPSQLALLVHAHRNDGIVPPGTFAYYGVFRTVGGMEPITDALTRVSDMRDDAAAERYLCDTLDKLQMIAAGGFLGVKRNSFFDGHGTLAERYVAAIRDSRVDAGTNANGKTTYITPVSLRACIRAGWLDEKWRITEAGYAAGRAVDPTAFAPLYDDGDLSPERLAADEDEARRIHHALYGLPGDPDPADMTMPLMLHPIIEEGTAQPAGRPPLAHTDPRREPYIMGQTSHGKNHTLPTIIAELERTGVPHLVVTVDEAREALSPATTSRTRAMLNALMAGSRDDRLLIMDPKSLRQFPTTEALEAALAGSSAPPRLPAAEREIVAAAMAGHKPDELTESERAAQKRGVSPATYRRLYPGVTGDLVDQFLPRLNSVRDHLARQLTQLGRQDLSRTVAGDVREDGYRVALHEIRTEIVLPERVRLAAFHLELALTTIRQGSRRIADRCLTQARANVT